jgi:FixJ family two-component response regulator
MSDHAGIPLIHIVDDEDPFRRSLVFLLESAGWQAIGYGSAEAFLQASPSLSSGGGCLVLDVRMPRISGLELQRRLQGSGSLFPVIFMTGHGDVELAVQAMKNGAVDFLQKPFKDQQFLDAVEAAVHLSLKRHAADQRCRDAREMLDRLSSREWDVARLLARGMANKEVAGQLGISDNTVHVHRQHVMAKTETGSVAELARLILHADPDGLD